MTIVIIPACISDEIDEKLDAEIKRHPKAEKDRTLDETG